MNNIKFNQIIFEAKELNPFWFEDDDENEITTIQEINEIESFRELKYPEQYKYFISKYGAGEFAFTNIYSPKKSGEWSSWVEKEEYNLPHQFIPISDDGCGNYLGFIVLKGVCSESLYWADHEQEYEIRKNKA